MSAAADPVLASPSLPVASPGATARQDSAPSIGADLDFLANTGFVVAIVFATTALLASRTSTAAASGTLTLQWLAVGVTAPVYVTCAVLGEHVRRRFASERFALHRLRPFSLAFAAVAVFAAIRVAGLSHDRSVLTVVAAEILLTAAFVRRQALRFGLPVAALGIGVAWIFSTPLTYTSLQTLFLSASPTTALAIPAFIVALLLVVRELASDAVHGGSRRLRSVGLIAAIVIFVAGALRTDGVLTDYALYHRGYYVDPAELVRAGHWLLWDVPSQYGFLSVLSLAVLPFASVWQSLYIMIAVTLAGQAAIAFSIFRCERRGLLNYSFAFIACVAAYLGAGGYREPFGARLYPQLTLRFFWIVALLGIAFAIYRRREAARPARSLLALGYATWLAAVLWSVETAAWCTVVWVVFCIADAAIDVRSTRGAAALAVRRLWPLVALPLVSFAAIEAVYRAHFGHGPDWYAFIELSVVYTNDPTYHVPVDPLGPGWTIALELGGLAALALAALRANEYRLVPLLATTWFALWASASYYTGEAWSNHFAGIIEVSTVAAAIALFAARRLGRRGPLPVAVILSFAPLFIILITLALGEPANMAKFRFPGVPSYRFDANENLPTVRGELADIIAAAGIAPGDSVVFSNGFGWAKLQNGLLVPLARDRFGRNVEYRAWLPLSPWGEANIFYSLPYDRRRLYVERFRTASPAGGWYVAYRKHALCGELAVGLDTSRTVRNANYEAALCTPHSVPAPRKPR